MTLILVTASKTGTPGAKVGEEWLQSVRASASSPACEALKTLRDPAEAPGGG
jgi:hypothetical protein